MFSKPLVHFHGLPLLGNLGGCIFFFNVFAHFTHSYFKLFSSYLGSKSSVPFPERLATPVPSVHVVPSARGLLPRQEGAEARAGPADRGRRDSGFSPALYYDLVCSATEALSLRIASPCAGIEPSPLPVVVFLCVGPIGVGRRRAGLGPGDDDALLQSHRRDEKFVSWGRPCPASCLPYRGAVGPAGEAGSHHARPRKPGRAGGDVLTRRHGQRDRTPGTRRTLRGRARASERSGEGGDGGEGERGACRGPPPAAAARAAEGAACGDLEVLSLELALQPRTDTVRPKEEPSKVGAGPVEAHSFDVRAKC